MANVHDDSAVTSSGDQKEHVGFLQKIKDKLHIGHHKSEEGVATQAPTDSAAVSSTPTPPAKAEPVVAKPVEAEPPAAAPSHIEANEQHQPSYDAQPTTDLNSLTGHEAEHHGGVPTFLAALPDKDIPDEVTKDTATSEATPGHAGEFDSEEVFSKAQEGEHHHGVPTFMVALPDQDIPDEVTKGVDATAQVPIEGHQQHHATQGKELDSEEVFSHAQQGEHHGGVPTFMVALPDQEIPDEVNKGVTESETGAGTTGNQGEQFDSEEVFSKAQEGEHHHGVPTFMVALPDQDIPDEVTKGVDATAADDQ